MKKILLFVLVILIVGCHGSRGTDLGDIGEIGVSTNNLSSPSSIYFLVDQMLFAGNIEPQNEFDSHPILEIHIMDEKDQTLLACVGENQSTAMSYLGDDIITYGEIDARFVASGGAAFADDTPVSVRLINKGSSHESCPYGYNSDTLDENGETVDPDLILATVNTTYGELLNSGVEFTGVATTYFRNNSMEPRLVELSETVEGGQLVVDQFQLTLDTVDDAEYTMPELGLFIAEYGSFEMLACVELEDVDVGGVLFGTLNYGFVDSSDISVELSDFDLNKQYWVLLVEQDDERCPNADAILSGNGILAYTTALNVSDLLVAHMAFEDDYGAFTFVTE